MMSIKVRASREQALHEPKESRLGRDLALHIGLPIFLGLALLAGAGFGLWQVNPAGLSAGADASLILLAFPLGCLGAFPLLASIGLTLLTVRVIGWLPGVLGRGREIVERVHRGVDRGADMLARPYIMVAAAGAVLRAIGVGMKSFFRVGNGESHE